ncbi:MAG: glycosyltransferase [Ignavibacteriales bacterium]|nr:glycosyltransferase [Ignavibacteriales bacterium]
MADGRSIALVQDWLTGMRGGEKVLEVLCELYPDADIVTLLHNKGAMSPAIEAMRIRTSFINRLPWKATKYRRYLPLMPAAIELMDFSRYDLIISSSHAVAKAALPRRGALHICYCHTPMRYIWDQYNDYFGRGKAGIGTRAAMLLATPVLRHWDLRTSARVHHFIANSRNVAGRVERIYGRTAEVIHAPVNTEQFQVATHDEGYYLIVSAMVPYKRVDLAIEVFNRRNERLLVVGTGPERGRLERGANKNIEFLGWRQDDELAKLYAGCKALIFPGEEDFGIVPLEAMASGKPVIAFAKGGALETVVDGSTGVFFRLQTSEELTRAIERCSSITFDPQTIRQHAEGFSRPRFRRQLNEFIETAWQDHVRGQSGR